MLKNIIRRGQINTDYHPHHSKLATRFFKTTQPSKRLSEKNLGPYEIIGAPGSHSFTIRLPPQFQTVHPVFHISQLKLAVPNLFPNHFQPPPPPVEINGKPEYEVSKI